MKRIQSAANPFLQQLVKLATTTRARHESRTTLLEGLHLVQELRRVSPRPGGTVVIAESALENVSIAAVIADVADDDVVVLSDGLFGKVSSGKGENALLAVVNVDALAALNPLEYSGFQLWLDRVQDPGNVGAIIRTAAAAGANAVLLNRGCADAWSPKCLRAAMGGHLHVHVGVDSDLGHAIKLFEGRVLAAQSDSTAKSVFESDLKVSTAIVLGNEGEGIDPSLVNQAAGRIRVPMPGATESLNVAAAAAVLAFEKVRQLT